MSLMKLWFTVNPEQLNKALIIPLVCSKFTGLHRTYCFIIKVTSVTERDRKRVLVLLEISCWACRPLNY